ncbi:MAG: hypothetical protein LAT57_03185 [Balneolales bacterium]|nr:hypothetical protein [Balneolales bacterium]
MGQQQLLLVILVTIIVGIATVVAINTFGSSAQQANRDAVRQDLATIASSSQAWYIRPTMLEGGGNSFSNVTFRTLNFPAQDVSEDGLTATNPNGRYVIGAASSATQLVIVATPSSNTEGDAVTITANITANNLSLSTAEGGDVLGADTGDGDGD